MVDKSGAENAQQKWPSKTAVQNIRKKWPYKTFVKYPCPKPVKKLTIKNTRKTSCQKLFFRCSLW